MVVVVLDRDGVINAEQRDDYIRSVDAFEPLPGAIKAIAELSRAGYAVYVATNQSGIAQGLYSEADLECIHQHLHDLVANAGGRIEAILHCPHHRDAGCSCRKPKPGMLDEIARMAGITANRLIFVGDAATDAGAADAAGCRFILVRTGKGNDTLRELAGSTIESHDNLRAVASHLLQT